MKKLIYILTILFLSLGLGITEGVLYIIQTVDIQEAAKALGYPLYFFSLLGLLKFFGGVALLLPKKYLYIKELVYFIFSIEMVFTSYSYFMAKVNTLNIFLPLLFLGIIFVSHKLSKETHQEYMEKRGDK